MNNPTRKGPEPDNYRDYNHWNDHCNIPPCIGHPLSSLGLESLSPEEKKIKKQKEMSVRPIKEGIIKRFIRFAKA